MKPGQKIVCINGEVHPVIKKLYKEFPILKGIYTVRCIRPLNAEGGILLNELRNTPVYLPHYGGYIEPAFAQERFRLCGEETFEEDRVEIDIKKRHLIQSN